MRIKKCYIFRIVAIIVVILLFYGVNSHFSRQGEKYKYYTISKNCTININCEYEFSGDAKYFNLHNLKRGDVINISIILPNCGIKNAIATFEGPNAAAEAYIDDKLVYSVGTYSELKTIAGYYIAKIPIPNEMEGKRLDIKLVVNEPSVVSEIPTIKIINARESDLLFLSENCYNLFIAVFLASIGFIGLVFIIFNFGLKKEYRKVIWMSFISISAAVWIFSCFNIMELFTKNYIFLYYTEFISLFISLCFMCLYSYECVKTKNKKFVLKIMFYISFIFTVTVVILQINKIVYFSEILSLYHVIAIVSLIIITILFLSEINKEDFKDNIIIIGFLIFILTASLYAILYLVNKTLSSYAVWFLPFVLLIWDITNYTGFIIEISKKYLSEAQKKSLLDMAYIDALTGIANRRACEKKITEAKDDLQNNYVIYSFDINSLKYVNDNYGHAAGDEIIKIFSEALSKVFCNEGDFAGRMGGDEFMVMQIFDNNKTINAKKFLTELEETVDLIDSEKNNEYHVSYSSGYDICDRKDKKGIVDAILLADEKMYVNKENNKKN